MKTKLPIVLGLMALATLGWSPPCSWISAPGGCSTTNEDCAFYCETSLGPNTYWCYTNGAGCCQCVSWNKYCCGNPYPQANQSSQGTGSMCDSVTGFCSPS